MNLSTAPKLSFSFIVIEIAGGEAMVNCLQVLQSFELACIAVLREEQRHLQDRFDNVQFNYLAGAVPLRRQRGVELSDTDIVILIEDTTVPDASLLAGLELAFQDERCMAASGPVRVGSDLAEHYQALACTEYGRYHSSVLFPDGKNTLLEVDRLPGNFICYRRSALKELLDENGLVEGAVNEKLLSRGASLLMVPELSVSYCGEDSWGGRCRTRYQHGRIYAGSLVGQMSFSRRLVQVFKSLLLPLVLSLRALGYMSRMQEIRRPLKVALWIATLELYWSAGELMGSVLGRPGNMEHWR